MLEIVLDKPDRSYFPGDTLSGKVKVSSAMELKSTGLKLKVQGFAKVKWKETDILTESVYKKTEWYLNQKRYLAGDGTTTMAFWGSMEYPFSVVLPQDLPPSFKSEMGNIIYHVEAVMKRQWDFDAKATIPFTIEPCLDLNNDPEASLPAEQQKMKTVGILNRTRGDIGLHIKIPKRGFTPGETLPVRVTVTNMSSKRVERVNVYLFQKRKYITKKKTKTEKRIVALVTDDGAEAFRGQVIRTPVFVIPELPPSELGGCEIIELKYKLKIEVVIPGFHLNLWGNIPITIGTIPVVAQNLMQARPSEVLVGDNNLNESSSDVEPLVAAFDELQPPSYEEAVRGNLINFGVTSTAGPPGASSSSAVAD